MQVTNCLLFFSFLCFIQVALNQNVDPRVTPKSGTFAKIKQKVVSKLKDKQFQAKVKEKLKDKKFQEQAKRALKKVAKLPGWAIGTMVVLIFLAVGIGGGIFYKKYTSNEGQEEPTQDDQVEEVEMES